MDIHEADGGQRLAEAGTVIDAPLLEDILQKAYGQDCALVREGEVSLNEPSLILNTLRKDPTRTRDEALRRFYSLLRPGDPPNEEVAKALFERLFFHEKRYDLAEVGRYKLNHRLKLDVPRTVCTLTPADFLAIVREMILLFLGRGETDDIDHFGNRRVRSVGELLANQFSVGLSRMARIIKERMNLSDKEKPITPADLVNARTVSAVIQSFFGSSQLSQFMDQTEPALRADAQAAPVGPRPRRPAPRPRRLRGPRRALHALRPHVPDRDAGRPEHRPHRQSRHARAHQQLRLHRGAVPAGRQGRRCSGRSST